MPSQAGQVNGENRHQDAHRTGKVQNPNDVHFNAEGYDLLGKQVAAAIQRALK
jgi:lysophospholipase L1-like esterase